MNEFLRQLDAAVLGVLMVALAYFLRGRAKKRYPNQQKLEDIVAFQLTEQRLLILFLTGVVVIVIDIGRALYQVL